MRRPIHTRINPDLCTGCGRCVADCPTDALAMQNGKAVVSGTESLGCGHCAAICPTGAVTVDGIEHVLPRLATVDLSRPAGEPERPSVASLVRLMAARRSCRHFDSTPVPRGVLEDLVRIGTLAPSGTNSQAWTFTVVPDHAAVQKAGRWVADFFRRLNRISGNPLARLVSRELRRYHVDYRDAVIEGLREYERGGRDRLFHRAAALILVGSKPGATCPGEDALLATQNILLAAEAMGLGTCLIGFAVEAMRHDPPIQRRLGIPSEERIHAVIALGHPVRSYTREAGRKAADIRWAKA